MDDPLVCVVDDDDAVRLSMSLLIETLGLPVQSFASALDVLADEEALRQAHCLVLDVRMPGLSGVGLQERLSRLGHPLPIIFVSAHGDVPMVARAMREGPSISSRSPSTSRCCWIVSRRPSSLPPPSVPRGAGWPRSRRGSTA
jgi:FixJ family two-component response regulator